MVGQWSAETSLARKLGEELVRVCGDCFDLSTSQEFRPYLVVEADRKDLPCPLLPLSSHLREQVSHMLISKSVPYKKNGIILK
jgi:hypothetical protein